MTVTVTDTQIATLRTEAATAGDLAQSGLCALALGDVPTEREASALQVDWPGLEARDPGERDRQIARAECVRVIEGGPSEHEAGEPASPIDE